MVKINTFAAAIVVFVLLGLVGLSKPGFGQAFDASKDPEGQALIEAFDAIYASDLEIARQTLNKLKQRALANDDPALLLAYVDRVLTHFRYAEDITPIVASLERFQAEQQDRLSPDQAVFLDLAIAALHIQEQTDLDAAETTLLALQQNPIAKPFEAKIKRTLGDLYQTLGQYPRAIEFYTDALRLDSSAPFRANVYNNLGNTTGFLEDWTQSIEYYLNAIEIYEGMGQTDDVLLVQANLGATYRAAGQVDEALEVYQSGLEALETMGSPDLEAQFQMNLGNLYVDQGQLDLALQALERSLAVCLENSFSYCVLLNHLNIGHAHYVNGDFDQALSFYDMTAEDLTAIDDPYIERQLMENYSDLYRDQGDFERALVAADRYQALDRQLINAEARTAAEEIQTRYETELKDAELAIQAEQIERQRAQIQIGIVLAAGVGAVLAVVIFFLSFRARTLQSLYERNQDLLRQNEVNQRLTERQSADPQQANTNPLASDGTSPSLEHVFERVTSALQQEGIYRDANLSLGDLAAHVASNSTYVSNAISQFANANFNNLVNYYRIMDARRQLNKAGANTSIAQLAQGCGFNSKASFYRAFSKYVGMTPSQYCQRLQANRTDAA